MTTLLQLLNHFFQSVIPNPDDRIKVALLFTVIAVLGVLLLFPRYKRQRANLVLGMTILTLLLMVLAAAIPNRWQWIIGLLPTLMVGYQLFFLWLYHPRETDGDSRMAGGGAQAVELREQSYRRAQLAIDNHFSLRTLFTRYGLPAVLLGITGIIVSDIMIDPDTFFSVKKFTDAAIADTMLRGIRLGAVGAYVYVLLELGRRTFRHDVTGAVAMWCWVTMVLGPVLAATIAFLWRIPPGDSAGWWGTGVVLFFTGFAPRRVIAAVESAAVQLLKIGTPTVVQSRQIPLSQVRGISPQIEERLGEEGITDVNSLASAEPVRLVRNTSFDMRQILTWIDEAILIVTLPRSWEALEEEGITGAIDLAWYYYSVVDRNTGQIITPLPPEILKLATKAKLDDPLNLVATIQRLGQDTQVQYIWTLYNNFTEFSGGSGQSSDTNDQASHSVANGSINQDQEEEHVNQDG